MIAAFLGKYWLYALAALTVVGAFTWYTLDQRKIGANNALQGIERANDAAKGKFNAGETDVNACYNSGGDWDRFERVCKPVTGK